MSRDKALASNATGVGTGSARAVGSEVLGLPSPATRIACAAAFGARYFFFGPFGLGLVPLSATGPLAVFTIDPDVYVALAVALSL
jgi:hypothetical protein